MTRGLRKLETKVMHQLKALGKDVPKMDTGAVPKPLGDEQQERFYVREFGYAYVLYACMRALRASAPQALFACILLCRAVQFWEAVHILGLEEDDFTWGAWVAFDQGGVKSPLMSQCVKDADGNPIGFMQEVRLGLRRFLALVCRRLIR